MQEWDTVQWKIGDNLTQYETGIKLKTIDVRHITDYLYRQNIKLTHDKYVKEIRITNETNIINWNYSQKKQTLGYKINWQTETYLTYTLDSRPYVPKSFKIVP